MCVLFEQKPTPTDRCVRFFSISIRFQLNRASFFYPKIRTENKANNDHGSNTSRGINCFDLHKCTNDQANLSYSTVNHMWIMYAFSFQFSSVRWMNSNDGFVVCAAKLTFHSHSHNMHKLYQLFIFDHRFYCSLLNYTFNGQFTLFLLAFTSFRSISGNFWHTFQRWKRSKSKSLKK